MILEKIKIKIIAYGIAKDILGDKMVQITVDMGTTISHLKVQLIESYPKFADLFSIRFAVNESYQDEDYHIVEGDEIVIIPPVAGG